MRREKCWGEKMAQDSSDCDIPLRHCIPSCPTGHSLSSSHTGLQADGPSSSRSALPLGSPLSTWCLPSPLPRCCVSGGLRDCWERHPSQHHLALFPDSLSSTASILPEVLILHIYVLQFLSLHAGMKLHEGRVWSAGSRPLAETLTEFTHVESGFEWHLVPDYHHHWD